MEEHVKYVCGYIQLLTALHIVFSYYIFDLILSQISTTVQRNSPYVDVFYIQKISELSPKVVVFS